VSVSYLLRPTWFNLFQGVLLGDTLYIDGGDFWYPNEDGKPIAHAYNSTYSLDLSVSWSPEDVRFSVIDKGQSPLLNRPNLWPAPDGKSFYSFNGDVSMAGNYTDPPSTPQLWQFTPDGKNNGTWRLAGPVSSLIQVQAARSTFGNGSAYILGGIATWRTTNLYGYDDTYAGSGNGIVSYDMNSQTWQNQSMAGAAPTGWWYESELHWVENLGGSGLVVALGGVTAQPLPKLAGETLVSFNHVFFFNPITGEWQNQSTTGAVPTPRRRACSVGVPGDNGTYEVRALMNNILLLWLTELSQIFLHGGSILPAARNFKTVPQAVIDLDQVWVLSLPSFTWYKSNYEPADARFLHTCDVPGNPPRRQMVVVGGMVPELEYNLEPRDPWPQGLGIFDLTEMQWRNDYDVNADAYETPRMVKDGIAKEGTYPKKWDSPELARWLTVNRMWFYFRLSFSPFPFLS
jgi:Kelch motif